MTTAIILAGGLGTRLRGMVPNLPKPMAPVSGRPFLEGLLDYWIAQGVHNFVISVGYMKKVIMDHFGFSYRDVPISYAVEEEGKALGTGGGLLLAAQKISEPFVVLNGDTFFEVSLSKLLEFHMTRSSDWTFSLFKANEFSRYMGMDLNADGKIVSIKMSTSGPARLANGGAYLLSPSALEKTKFLPGEKFSLEDELLPDLMGRGCKFFGIEFSNRFIDIGVPQDYLRANEFM
jgi:D-glycero-alpha-D-manno-heptose 1-phosphate guanylyltransferase